MKNYARCGGTPGTPGFVTRPHPDGSPATVSGGCPGCIDCRPPEQPARVSIEFPPSPMGAWAPAILAADIELKEVKAERDALRDALRPFGSLLDRAMDDKRDGDSVWAFNGNAITYGDLRRAAALGEQP